MNSNNFSLELTLFSQVEVTEISGASEPISALEFNSTTSSLAVGNDCGLVQTIFSKTTWFDGSMFFEYPNSKMNLLVLYQFN